MLLSCPVRGVPPASDRSEICPAYQEVDVEICSHDIVDVSCVGHALTASEQSIRDVARFVGQVERDANRLLHSLADRLANNGTRSYGWPSILGFREQRNRELG